MINVFLVGSPSDIDTVLEVIQSNFSVIKSEKNPNPTGLGNFQSLMLILRTPVKDRETCDINLDEVLDN